MKALLLALLAALPLAAQAPPGQPEGGTLKPGERRKLAGLVVRSKDWTVHRGADTVEEWNGDVSYKQRGREVYADWAERRHARDLWRARGRVRMVWKMEDGTILEARGHEAQHDGVAETGWMRPSDGSMIELERRLPALPEPDRGVADRLSWEGKRELARMEGHVRTWGPSGHSWSDNADYSTTHRRLTLTGGRPVLVSGANDWNGAVQADVVIATDKPQRIEGKGRARGWLIFEDRPKAMKGS